MKAHESRPSSGDYHTPGASTPAPHADDFDAVSAERDMRVLNIQVDSDAILRMHDLGMVKAWEVGSKVAQTIRERNPEQVASAFSVARVPNSHESRKVEELEQLAHREKEDVDHAFVASVFRRLCNRDDFIAPNIRAEVIRLLQMFKIQYARNPQKFILQMMGKKTYFKSVEIPQLTAHHIVLKSRYVDQKDFREIIKRLNAKASDLHIECMFDVIGTHKEIGGKVNFVLDLWAFLDLLKHAAEDNRRSFDFKSSKIANDVEFWNQRSARAPNQPNRVRKSSAGSPGTVEERESNARPHRAEKSSADDLSLSTRDTLAGLIGAPHRPHTGERKSGRCVKGAFTRDASAPFSVPEALSSPLRPPSTKTSSHRMKGINFGYEYSLNLGKLNVDNVDPAAIERVMNEGEGVSNAIHGRSIVARAPHSGPTSVGKQRTSSSGALTKRYYTNESVAQLISSSPSSV